MEADTIDALSLMISLVGVPGRGTLGAGGGILAKDWLAWARLGATSPLGVETSLRVLVTPPREVEAPALDAGVSGLATAAAAVTGVGAAEEEEGVDVPVDTLSTGVIVASCFAGTALVAAAMLSTPAAGRLSARFSCCSCLEGVAARSGLDGVATLSGFEGVATRSGFDGVDTRSGFGVATLSGFEGVATGSARPFLGVAAIDLGVCIGAGTDACVGLLAVLDFRESSAGKSSSWRTPLPLPCFAWEAMSLDKPLSAAKACRLFFASPGLEPSCIGPMGVVWGPWPGVAGRCELIADAKPGGPGNGGGMAMEAPCGKPRPGGASGVPSPGVGSMLRWEDCPNDCRGCC